MELTGASAHHFLATESLRTILSDFFAAQVLSPSLYLERADYTEAATLTDAAASRAGVGGALTEHLRTMEPLI
ncbi:MAG TPA: hypothetical protein VIW24_22035 [Aldersonia sp.]